MIHVVTGPPCAGKSTYVSEHAADGEVTIDFDTIAQALGSKSPHDAPAEIREVAFEARRAAIDALIAGGHDGWVIHTSPTDEQMQRYLDHDAEVHEINPGMDECLARAKADGRPERVSEAIREWFDQGKKGAPMKYKDFDAQIKSDGEGSGSMEAYASTFDRKPDKVGDIVAPGAFADSIKAFQESGRSIPLMYGHNGGRDPDLIIGSIAADALTTDAKGLRIRAEFLDTEKAQQCRRLVKKGLLRKLSIGYWPREQGPIEIEGKYANELRKVDLHEVSLVVNPANENAEVVSIKSDDEDPFERFAKAMGGLAESIEQACSVMQKAMDEFDGAPGADDDSEGDEGEGGGSQSGNPDEGEDQDGGNDRAKALLAQIKKITDQTKED